MAAPVRFYYSITTHTPAVLPVLIVYGLYTTSNPFEVIIQIPVEDMYNYNNYVIIIIMTQISISGLPREGMNRDPPHCSDINY